MSDEAARVSDFAALFPGQGSQAVGMGRWLYEDHADARAIFDAADRALGEPLSKLNFEGPEADLGLTANTQPAILTMSVAAWAVLEGKGTKPAFAAGHSLGEYTALVAAGALAFEDAVRLVRQRGRFMQEAVPVGVGAMAAIIGLPAAEVAAACAEAAQGEIVAPANLNAPEQTVIAGHTAAVARAGEACKARGAKRALPLPVSAPFHCSLMKPAQDRLAPLLAATTFHDARFPVVTNADATPVTDGAALRDALVRQVTAPVRWVESVETLARSGVVRVLEVGPGQVLAGLVKRIDRALAAESFGTVRQEVAS
jgi:[acyl-carrier-protein] S-malonyltransferase